MAVLEGPELQPLGSQHLAAAALLCGVMCSVLTLKFRFSLDLSRASSSRETPTVVGGGVYRANSSTTTFATSAVLLSKYQPISPTKVQLPVSSDLPPLPQSPPPKDQDNSHIIFPIPTPDSKVNATNVSLHPRGENLKVRPEEAIENENPKLTKKEQKLLDKKEKERIKEQKKKDKIIIAEILKDDAERIKREAVLLKEKQTDETEKKSEKLKSNKNKKDNKAPEQPKTQAKVANPLGQQSHPTANPLAQRPLTSSDTLKSDESFNVAPPPYSGPQVTPSESDSSGNTSFGKPVQVMGGAWDLVSQHRQQIARPIKGPAATVKIENSKYVVGNMNKELKDVPGQPRKSLYV